MFNNLFPENCAGYELMWKNITAREITDNNKAHAPCMLNN